MKHRARQQSHESSQENRLVVDEETTSNKRLRNLKIRSVGGERSKTVPSPSKWKRVCLILLVIWVILNRGLLFKTLCRSITLRFQSLPEYESLEGRLWRGSIPMDETTSSDEASAATIELVISHCDLPLNWIFEWTASAKSILNITIISKCGEPVVGAPSIANIVKLSNAGRCDHTYVHYIADNYDRFSSESEDTSYVVFLKDSDNSNRNHYTNHRNLDEMIQISKQLGFACHEEPSWIWAQQSILKGQPICRISTYHNWTVLQDYSLNMYARLRRDDNSAFASQSGSTLGEYTSTVGIEPPTMPVVPVCYGGNFMTQSHQLKRQSKTLWQTIERSLSRANNIAEGHFVERLWGTYFIGTTCRE